MKVKEESEKTGLKLNIEKTKIMAAGSHFMAKRWGNMEIMTDFVFLASKITADGDCSHEIKRCLLLGRKAMINLFIERTDVEAETPILWPPDVNEKLTHLKRP